VVCDACISSLLEMHRLLAHRCSKEQYNIA
jgi:hypothetical protein